MECNDERACSRQCRRLDSFTRHLTDDLVADLKQQGPFPDGWDICKTNDHEYRVRLNYRFRVRYTIQENRLTINVFYIGHRKDAYQ